MFSEADQQALRETFLFESEEGLAAIEQSLLQLERRPTGGEEIAEIFRVVHTLKGDAGTVGFDELSAFAHTVEDVLEQIRSSGLRVTSDLVSLLLSAVDALRDSVRRAARGEAPGSFHAGLRRRLERASATGSVADVETARPPRVAGSSAERQPDERRSRRTTSLRVAIGRLDALLRTVGEISVARGQLAQLLEAPSTRLEQAREMHIETEQLHLDLQEIAMKLRMVPVGPVFEDFQRTGRDLALRYGKQLKLLIEGADVEVDSSVLQLLKDPLTHIFRNAVDHGIETPAARRAAGKDPTGVIILRAYHRGGRIVIECEDDGAGVDRERIAARAREFGHDSTSGRRLDDAELLQLIVQPGFSTAEQITGLSGRGVGMDLVRRNVEALRGSVTLDSRPRRGSRITLRVPLTLSIIEGLLIRVASEAYVLAIDSVVESLDLSSLSGLAQDERGVISIRGRSVPYVRLRGIFGLDGDPPPRENLVVVKLGRREVGLVVDAVAARIHAVIRPLAKLLQGVRGIASSTVLGDGTVALVLDVETLLGEELARPLAIEGVS